MRLGALCVALGFVGCSLGQGVAPMWTFDDAPGAPPVDGALTERLATAWGARAANYVPRTQHLRPDGSPKYINRLFLESSPYLRQHAHNPLNWFPWGDEAFELARALRRPVLLSIGYSTCHWCHVMEEESFDDEEIAPVSKRALHCDQGRPRGAPRPRCDLHERGSAVPPRQRRVADDGLAHARSRAIQRGAPTSPRVTGTAGCRSGS